MKTSFDESKKLTSLGKSKCLEKVLKIRIHDVKSGRGGVLKIRGKTFQYKMRI